MHVLIFLALFMFVLFLQLQYQTASKPPVVPSLGQTSQVANPASASGGTIPISTSANRGGNAAMAPIGTASPIDGCTFSGATVHAAPSTTDVFLRHPLSLG